MTVMVSVAEQAQEARKGLWLLIASGVILGTLGVFFEEAGQDPLLTVWFRCTFGALALWVWALATGKVGEFHLRGKALVVALMVGGLMILDWCLFFAAIPRTSIAVATVLFHIQPVWVLLYSALILRVSTPAQHWWAVGVALCGLVLTTGLLEGSASSSAGGAEYLIGVVMCLLGSLFYAAVVIIAQRNPVGSALSMAWWQCVVGMLVLLWTPFVYGWPQELSTLGWLVGLGVVHTGLAYALIFSGMARLSLDNVALLQFVYPLVAVAVDWWVYDEVFSTLQVVGVGMMALALWRIKRPKAEAVSVG